MGFSERCSDCVLFDQMAQLRIIFALNYKIIYSVRDYNPRRTFITCLLFSFLNTYGNSFNGKQGINTEVYVNSMVTFLKEGVK